MDEATSSLDSVSEEKIQKALKKLLVGKTSLVIAHRLSTINDADEIFVLEKGKILDRGSHETLISRSGIYKNLYEIQFKVESDDKKIH